MAKKTLIAMLIALFSVAGAANADDGKSKLSDYFSTPEIVANGLALGANAYLNFMNSPDPAFGPPDIDSLDYKIWDDHRRLDHEKYADISDALLYSTLSTPLVIYTAGVFTDKIGFDNAEVRLCAYIEAMNVNFLLTNSAKKLLGRERPDGEDTESFFSGHSSTTFMAASFFSWDASNWLRSKVSDDAWVGLRIGSRALPFAVLYTAAGLTAYYRIAGEKHWFSDVMTGSIVGAGCGNAIYLLHFETDGDPKKRRANNALIYPIIGPEVNGIEVSWRF